MIEIWKDVSGFKNYMVSNLGRVKSLDRIQIVGSSTRFMKGVVFTIQTDKYGYSRVGIRLNKKLHYKLVHRLVAIDFLENPLNLPQVNHKDGDKTNNRLSNLEWMTSAENCAHAIRESLYVTAKGESTNRSHMTEDSVLKLREMYKELPNYTKLAKVFCLSLSSTRAIILRETWKHI